MTVAPRSFSFICQPTLSLRRQADISPEFAVVICSKISPLVSPRKVVGFQYALLFLAVRRRVMISKFFICQSRTRNFISFIFVCVATSIFCLSKSLCKCSIWSNYEDELGIIWKVLSSTPLVSSVRHTSEMGECKVLTHKALEFYRGRYRVLV